MNTFEYAMQMEKDSESYYRELSDGCSNKGLKSILDWLADEEVKHFKLIEQMSKGESPRLTETNILSDAKNIFAQMKEKKEQLDLSVSGQELYRKAQDLERKTEEFYLQKAEEMKDQSQKELLLKIAGEEKKHYFLLDNIIEFVSRPETWLENAEFFHLDEY